MNVRIENRRRSSIGIGPSKARSLIERTRSRTDQPSSASRWSQYSLPYRGWKCSVRRSRTRSSIADVDAGWQVSVSGMGFLPPSVQERGDGFGEFFFPTPEEVVIPFAANELFRCR